MPGTGSQTQATAPAATPSAAAEAPPTPAPTGPAIPTNMGQVSQALIEQHPWAAPLINAADAVAGAGQSVVHGATYGLDEILAPLPAAIARTVRQGIPFAQAYDQEVQAQRQQRTSFEQTHPVAGTAAELAGGIASPLNALAAPLFGVAAPTASLGTKAITAARNVAASAGLGAAAGAGMTDGDLAQRASGAAQGAEVGGLLGTVIPALGAAVGGAIRAATPTRQVPRLAGQLLNEAASTSAPSAAPEVAPLPGFPIGAGASVNDPGLAALERRSNTLNDAAALQMQAGQNAAITRGATTAQPATGTRLAYQAAPPDASGAIVRGMNNASGVIRQEEERLWTKPTIAAKTVDMPGLKQSVQRRLAALPARYHAVMQKESDLRSALNELANLPADATLADINHVRSDLLGLARTLPPTEAFEKRVASEAASAILDAVESNPALRNDPQAWLDYQRARAFTARKWDVLGNQPFQSMLRLNRWGNQGVDERTAANSVFGFGGRNAGERVPQGVANVTRMLDDIQRQWSALQTGMVKGAGAFPPAVAQAARAELAQGARDFIVNSMLDAATTTARDFTDAQRTSLNRISDWIDTNRDWIGRSKLFNTDQLGLLDDIRKSAILGARTQNLRGGTGSESYERLVKDPKFIDLFTTPFIRWGAAVGGAGIGAMFGGLSEAGIGALLGMGAESIGQQFLQRVYQMPREALRQKLEEAIRNPVIARDVRMKASAPGRISPDTIRWARSILATQPPAQGARVAGVPTAVVPPPGSPVPPPQQPSPSMQAVQ